MNILLIIKYYCLLLAAFVSYKEEELEKLARSMVKEHYAKGQTIFYELGYYC